MSYFHPTSYISSSATVGKDTNIWHYSHIDDNSKIGMSCNIGQGCYVGKEVSIGNASRIGNCVAVFEGITIHDFVFLGPFMVFTHIRTPRAFISRKEFFENTDVKKGASLGANSTITPGLKIEEFTLVAAGAILTKSTKPYSLWVGAPAKHVGWVDIFGQKLPYVNGGSSIQRHKCSITDDLYEYSSENCIRHETEKSLSIITFSPEWSRINIEDL